MQDFPIQAFYGYWQLGVCTFAFLALMAIWWHIGRRQGDFGQVWLALSVLCWSVSGLVELLYLGDINQTQQLNAWRSIFSLFNSAFILLSLPWFRYMPERFSRVVKSPFWPLIVGLPFVFSLLPIVSQMLRRSPTVLSSELDIYYAMFTLLFLGVVLWYSFAKRRLFLLAVLSAVCILVTLSAQLLKLTDLGQQLLLSAVFKTCLIMIFFALALSWVKELVEHQFPVAEQLFLRLRRKKEGDKWKHEVLVKGFPGVEWRQVSLGRAGYELLDAFIIKRTEGGEGWLEIKPKGESFTGRQYDIQDYNQLKRLQLSLLDGLFGKGNWSENQHQQPLKETIFEWSQKRERKVRLRLPANHLSREHNRSPDI